MTCVVMGLSWHGLGWVGVGFVHIDWNGGRGEKRKEIMDLYLVVVERKAGLTVIYLPMFVCMICSDIFWAIFI